MNPIKLKSLFEQLMTNKTRVIINGTGGGKFQTLITEVHEDYIGIEVSSEETEKVSQKVKTSREKRYIPISAIHEISEGAVETITKPPKPKPEKEEKPAVPGLETFVEDTKDYNQEKTEETEDPDEDEK